MMKEFIIQMQKDYPFGELGETMAEDTKTYVKKTLHYEDVEQYDVIKQMIHFFKAVKHESLINFLKILEAPHEIQIYYEYAPFRLEKWLVMVDEGLLALLYEQMLDLAEYLTRSSIKFNFNPDCLGLSKDMSIKYFLNQFLIDFQNQETQEKQLFSDIKMHFKELGLSCNENEKEYKKANFIQSLSTNASISPFDPVIALTNIEKYKTEQIKPAKKNNLSQKVQNSMKKSIEALLRFKRKGSN